MLFIFTFVSSCLLVFLISCFLVFLSSFLLVFLSSCLRVFFSSCLLLFLSFERSLNIENGLNVTNYCLSIKPRGQLKVTMRPFSSIFCQLHWGIFHSFLQGYLFLVPDVNKSFKGLKIPYHTSIILV